MDKKNLLTSFKEIQTLLSDGYNEKLYLNPEKFNKCYIEEFCRQLFYIISEQNDNINNLQKENKNLKSDVDSLKKEVEVLSRKIRH